jgi:diaminopimelate epimerase
MISFTKMHGAGNDFVVIDNREGNLSTLDWRKLADRHTGIGCDQAVLIEASATADVRMRIFNADGGEVESCGNASRCVAWVVAQQAEHPVDTLAIETLGGTIRAQIIDNSRVRVDMGEPRFGWNDIPLANACDTLHLPVTAKGMESPVAINMGNPHMVFFVEDIQAVPLEIIGPQLERHPLFPARANVEIAQVTGSGSIALSVWERGAGLTLACGTGACATLVAASRRGLTGRKADVQLPGGTLHIEWAENNHVLMTGPTAVSFHGRFDERQYA